MTKNYNIGKEEYKREWYLKNKQRILEKRKQYAIDNADKINEYKKTLSYKKSYHISNWKIHNLVGNYDEIWERYCDTTNCDLCNVILTTDKRITTTTKCMEHNHETGEFRNITCHKCNMTRKGKYKNNTSGHKGIYVVKQQNGDIRYRHKTKRFKTIEEAVNYKNSFLK